MKFKQNQETEISFNSQEFKIVFLSYMRLSDRVAKTWFINEFKNKGINVEYWDLVAILRENHHEYGEITPDYLKVIKSQTEFKVKIKSENPQSIYIPLFPIDTTTYKIYRNLSKIGAKYVYIDWGAMPLYGHQLNNTLMRKIMNLIKTPTLLLPFLNSKKVLLMCKIGFIKKFKIIFAAGEFLENSNKHAIKKIPIAFADFEEYQLSTYIKSEVKSKYAVFLDINLPFQSDLALLKMQRVNSEKYYDELESFFTKVEIQYDLEVKIAAHPKSSPDEKKFKGRIVERLKTAEMVREAELVICHQSTSLSYAVLNSKPIFFIYTEEMLEKYKNTVVNEIENLASYFDSKAINISDLDSISLSSNPKINQNRYEQYIDKYIATRDARSKKTQEVIYSSLIKL